MEQLFDTDTYLVPVDDTSLSLPTPTQLGAVFTKRWVTQWILDLVGYTTDNGSLISSTIIEPACGDGAFLEQIVERLLEAWLSASRNSHDLFGRIEAYDLDEVALAKARAKTLLQLEQYGIDNQQAQEICSDWLRHDDFLLADKVSTAKWVVGNPPYVRMEEIPADRQQLYRSKFATLRGRADLYVAFYERCLDLLDGEGAKLGFICADRWMRNNYGKTLRSKIGESFHMHLVMSLHGVDCFEEKVSAYPAVTVLSNTPPKKPVVGIAKPDFDGSTDPEQLSEFLRSSNTEIATGSYEATKLDGWFTGDMWPSANSNGLAFLRHVENNFGLLQDTDRQTQIGIGVATGADSIFIPEDSPNIESNRLLPLATANQIGDGYLSSNSTMMVNPWLDGRLVDLDNYPKLANYFTLHEHVLRKRHVARKNPTNWYRTIDKVTSELIDTPKILLADLKARITPVVEYGGLYPHHNLYWITSKVWDLEVLAGILLSDHVNSIVGSYCVRMSGGTMRFQAQYLRKIRVPHPSTLSYAQKELLREAYLSRSIELANKQCEKIYGRVAPTF